MDALLDQAERERRLAAEQVHAARRRLKTALGVDEANSRRLNTAGEDETEAPLLQASSSRSELDESVAIAASQGATSSWDGMRQLGRSLSRFSRSISTCSQWKP